MIHRFKLSAARSNAAILAAYTLAAFLLTWPLVRHFTTHVPGDGIDDPSLAWNLWWVKERLIDQRNWDIFHVDWMFHPIDINLGFYTLTPLNGLLSIPLQTAFSLIIASNLILLSSFVIGGFGAYLLAIQELKTQTGNWKTVILAALFAGFVYAFASSKLFYVSLGQFNIASSQWVPFCALYLLRLSRATSWRSGLRDGCLAGFFLTLQAWAELTYASFLLIFAALVFLWSLFDRSRMTRHASRMTNFLICGLVFLIGIAPFLWAMIPDLLREGDFFASGGGFADTFSADLAGYLLPTRLHPFWGDWVMGLSFPHDKGQQIFLGYSVMLLALIGSVTLLRQPKRRPWGIFWLAVTLFFGWMTLGAQVRWLGEPLPIPGPFDLISRLPFFSGNRYPSRYSVLLLLCVAVLAGAGVQWLLQVVSRPTSNKEGARLSDSGTNHRSLYRSIPLSLCVALVILFILEHLAIPLPLSDFRTPPIYEKLAAEPGDFALLELPTGWRNGARVLGKSDILIMMQQWYQTAHGKRRLGGNTSRNPPYKFQYFTNTPLIGDLIALMNAEANSNPANTAIAQVVDAEFDTIIARNRPIAGQVLEFLGVRYVSVHVEKSPPSLLRFVDEALPLTLVEEWRGPDWSGAASTIHLYRVNPTVPTDWEIDLAASAGQLYLAEGWSALATNGVRYATRPCATLLLNLPDRGGQIRFALAADLSNATIRLNGYPLTGVDATTPPGSTTALIDRVELCFDHRTPLANLVTPDEQSGWPIGETGAFIKHSLVVQSAGNDVGNFAHIFIDGVDVSPNQVGYNLVALDAPGVVQDSKSFNTLVSSEESQALADWLQQWPAGTIIAGAVRDEASMKLTETAVNALKAIGLTTDLRERFRWSHAFIGVVGASSGSALEATSLLQPATVSIGIAVDAPAVYGGVGRIWFTANP